MIFRESRRKKIDRVPKSAGKIQNFQVLIVIIIITYRDCALPISIILADLEINLNENSGAKQHKLYYMRFS